LEQGRNSLKQVKVVNETLFSYDPSHNKKIYQFKTLITENEHIKFTE